MDMEEISANRPADYEQPSCEMVVPTEIKKSSETGN